jgi:23S rRNA pseudouridine955/2504/2580 synthase
LQVRAGTSLLQIRLLTGRTHQIRAQLAAFGYPVLGDSKYGDRRAERMYLHAARIVLPDGTSFVCPPPWSGERAVSLLPEIMPEDMQSPFSSALSDG